MGAADPHALEDLSQASLVKLHSCLPYLYPWRCGPWGLSWASGVSAAFKSPPLCFIGTSILEMTPHLQLPSSPQRLLSRLMDLASSLLPFPSKQLGHSGDPCSPPSNLSLRKGVV